MLLTAFIKKLEDPTSPEHNRMVDHVVGLRKISSRDMSQHYPTWDYHDKVFRGERPVDKEDRNAAAKGQPNKMIVPLTFSQIQTYVAFNVSVLTQNRRFYELEPTGSEDNPLREPLELILERDLRRNTWMTHLIQWFLDLGRFSLAAAEVGWQETTRMIRTEETVPTMGPFQTEGSETQVTYTAVPVFCGNRVLPISPYKFYPDTRLPLTRYQEGEFCGSEDTFSMASLRGNDALINVDKIPKMTADMYRDRKKTTRIPELETRENVNMGSNTVPGEVTLDDGAYVKSGPVQITKMVFDLVPKDFKVDSEPIGAQTFTCRFLCWVANDQTIVRFEEVTLLHGMFPYVCAQHLPDQHRTVNMSLAESCDQLTSLVTWLINAHVTSQRNVIKGGKFILDPAGIDVKGIDSDSPYIFLKKNASQTGVDRYAKQFTVTDPTANFMADASAIKGLLGEVTGYNETMGGAYSQGRRSATQDRVVAQNGSARGKCTLGGVWDTLFDPLGKQLISNNRQEMDEETFWRIVGSDRQQETPGLFETFKADPITIATAEDFFTFDATIPSEKAFLAQSLQEILMMMMQSPQVAQMMGYGPEQFKAIFQDIYNLRGVTPSRLPAPTQPQVPQAGIIPMPPAPAPSPAPAQAALPSS